MCASSIAGSTSSAHARRPKRRCASSRPGTNPGTATDASPTWKTCVEASPIGDASTQVFHVGEASVAVPGLVPGLEEAHLRFGRLAWAELVEPAIELAHIGLDVNEAQAFLHLILAGILQRDEGGRRIYGDPLRLFTQDLVPTLERIRDGGAAAIRDLVPELADDLSAYRVAE